MYSLVKTPKGCNISTGEIMNVHLNIKDITDIKEREEQWIGRIDTILDKGTDIDILAYGVSILNDHDSHVCTTSDYLLTYIAGYVAGKGKRFCRNVDNNNNVICEECLKTLVLQPNDEIPERHKLIQMKTKGHLINPSVALFNLLSTLEKGIIETTKCEEIDANTLFVIMGLINEEKDSITFVGCEKHNHEFTKNIVRFYLITQMFFLVKQANKNDYIEREKIKEKRKSSKLVKANAIEATDLYCRVKETNAAETVIQMKTNHRKRRKIDTSCGINN